MREQLQRICESWGCNLYTGIALSHFTTFHIGGKADYCADISCVEGLQALLCFCKENDMPFFVLGRGSNVLASDRGYRGLILHLGDHFSKITVKGNQLVCQAGAGLAAAARTAAQHSLTGMEALCGIPGTIGGALYMNAGAYGSEMKDIVRSCEYLDQEGGLHTLFPEEMHLSYRRSLFSETGGIIVSVTLELQPGDQAAIRKKMEELLHQRRTKQPLEYPSAGSTFKRPEGSYASLLIDQCGLKGRTVGGAQVSTKHCGFVINTGNATCADVLELCSQVREIVQKEKGITLELEPVILQ